MTQPGPRRLITSDLVATRDGDDVVLTYRDGREFRITRDELVVDVLVDEADLEAGALTGWWKDGFLRLEVDGAEEARLDKFEQVRLAGWIDCPDGEV